MAYLTVDQALEASRDRWPTVRVAETEIRKSAAVSMAMNFDVFLSHSYEDSRMILGVRTLLEGTGLTVYVDWIEDAQADRSQVTAETADMLRVRMAHSGALLFVSTRASVNSKWMPWELGYFDGLRPGKIGILPVLLTAGGTFQGQEYLGLYPVYEILNFPTEGGRQFGRRTGMGEGETLKKTARSAF